MADETPGKGMPLGALYRDVRAVLCAAGILDAGREARHLIGVLAEIPAERFLADPDAMVAARDCEQVFDGARKRAEGMPAGRIAGVRDFYGRPFFLGPAILEPRFDSEVLIEAAFEIIQAEGMCDRPIRIVDVGTGSGCLLITLLAELPMATGFGVDLAPDAVGVAGANARRYGVAGRAVFAEGDALKGVEGVFDLLISNPPYIRSDELAGLDVAVRRYDPQLALDGGADGMDIYRRIGGDIVRVVPDGWMLFEVGAGMAADVCHEIDQFAVNGHCGQRPWRVWPDLNGHDRCVAAKTLYA